MPVILMLKGLPASGKTTYAKEKVKRDSNWVRVNKDDIRRCMFGGQRSVAEKLVIQTEDAQIRFFMTKKKNVIIDDTNLNPHHERRLQMLIEKHNKGVTDESDKYSLEMLVFETPLDTCFHRNLGRSGDDFVPPSVIQEMYDKYMKSPENDAKNDEAKKARYNSNLEYISTLDKDIEKIQTTAIRVVRQNESSKKNTQDPSLPHVVLSDIDGTCALMNGRSPYDMTKVHEDKPNQPVVGLLQKIYSSSVPVEVIFMSGRTDDSRDLTIEWLRKHLPFSNPKLFMRKAGDNRKDSIVKEELYREHIQPNYYVDFILDDRNQVVQMWRELGLTCFQVAEGNF